MRPLRRLSLAEQTAAHLREGLRRGRWSGVLPGVVRLAEELDVSPPTVQEALRQLEAEGLLGARGRGRSRSIIRCGTDRRTLRVGMLLFEPLLEEQPQTSQVLFQVQRDLETAGHEVFLPRKTQVEFDHDAERIVRHVCQGPVPDAWIVVSGSRQLLEWFARQPVPCLALYGRTEGLALARTGPDKASPYIVATRQLLELGHTRIVMLARRPRREPVPGNVELAVLAELASHGIRTGSYNLPKWEETAEGFGALLESLFRLTPPTALIIEEAPLAIAATQFLARRRISVPEQVSVVSADYDASLAWCHPAIAHMRWNIAPIVRRIVRWVGAVRRGCPDRETVNFPAEFIPGGSFGPAPGTKH